MNIRQLPFALVLVCLLTWACGGGSAKPTTTANSAITPTAKAAVRNSWVYSGRDGVAYISWTDHAGSLSGQMQTLRPSLAGQPFNAQSDSFDGVLSGEQVSLRFASGTTWTGTLRNDTLTLVAPSALVDGGLVTFVLTPGTAVEYNRDANAFRGDQSAGATSVAAIAARTASAQEAGAFATTVAAKAAKTAAADAFRQAVTATGVKYQIITPFESSACAAPYTSYTQKAFSNHEYTTVFTMCVNLNAVGALYQGRPAWYVIPAGGCPREAFGYEPYADLHQEGPIVCIDGVLLHDADRISG